MKLIDRLLDTIAPHCCLLCTEEGSLLCEGCAESNLLPVPSRCVRCNAQTPDSEVCRRCRRTLPLRHVWVATEYEGAAKDLIHAFKFERAQAAAKPMSALMERELPHLPSYVVCHVPTATSRRRQRGYDQSQLLATAIASAKTLPCFSLLGRRGQTRQVGATKQRRTQQLADAFYVKYPALVAGKHVLLVDDIYTTGATVTAAATALKTAGAKSVSAVVFAQKK